jgi:hypothetical protein
LAELRKTSGPKRDEVKVDWRMLHTEELHYLHSARNIMRVITSRTRRRTGHVAPTRGRRGAYRDLVGRPEGKRPLGRPWRRWEDIEMDLQEVGWGVDGLEWSGTRQGQVIGARECGIEPSVSNKMQGASLIS